MRAQPLSQAAPPQAASPQAALPAALAQAQAGYVLFDALVGLAIAALVMAMVTLSLRSAGDLSRRAGEEARARRDIMAAAVHLARWLEDAPLPEAETGASKLSHYPPAGQRAGTFPGHGVLRVVPGTPMTLAFESARQETDPVSLLQAGAMTLEHWPSFRLLAPDLVVVSVGDGKGGAMTALVLPHLRRFSPERIALPYGRKARKGATL